MASSCLWPRISSTTVASSIHGTGAQNLPRKVSSGWPRSSSTRFNPYSVQLFPATCFTFAGETLHRPMFVFSTAVFQIRVQFPLRRHSPLPGARLNLARLFQAADPSIPTVSLRSLKCSFQRRFQRHWSQVLQDLNCRSMVGLCDESSGRGILGVRKPSK